MVPVRSQRTLLTHHVVLIAVLLNNLEGAQIPFVQLVAIRAHLYIDQITYIVDYVFPIGVVTLLRQVLLLSNILAGSLYHPLS
jgi:hypothetical protein